MPNHKFTAGLDGVAETCLWTLWNRSQEAMRIDSDFSDPLAVLVAGQLDYPFEQRCGRPQPGIAMRAVTYDCAVAQHLRMYPSTAVVALAEGLQTSYWRLNRPAVPWISVDLPDVISLRSHVFPEEPRIVHVGASAFDLTWIDKVSCSDPPIITAEGLFMYFEINQVMSLINQCAERFPGGRLIFDGVPGWWMRRQADVASSTAGRKETMPAMQSSMSAHDASRLPEKLSRIRFARELTLPAGRGLAGKVHSSYFNSRVWPSRWRASLYELQFAT